jgi:phosphoribosylanthranilate isomerase
MTRAKICGLTRAADRDAAVAAGAHALGFVVDVPVETPREIAPSRAAALVAGVPPFVSTVLVTMPGTPARATELVERVDPDAVQAHGSLAPDELETLADATSARVIATVDAESTADETADVERYAAVADALLVDSMGEGGAGGTGRTHDWERTRDVVRGADAPVILAGGLTPENVSRAVRAVEPFAVDVASGVERDGGEKDRAALETFVERATGARAVRP